MLIPMLADFATRVACGLAVLLLATPWRVVPPAFFRTHCQVILGLLVLAALDLSRSGTSGAILALLVVSACLSYFASVAWGLGLPRFGLPVTALIALATAGALVLASRGASWDVRALNAVGRLSSAFLLGSTLTAMLLGHHYLTAPAMSIDPLRRFVQGIAWGLGARTVVAALGLWLLLDGRTGAGGSASASPFLLAIRWAMGLAGPTLATALTWKTVQIRSTQSATGILYIAFTLVLFGELSALVLSSDVGIAL